MVRVNALAQKAEYIWYDGQEGQAVKVRNWLAVEERGRCCEFGGWSGAHSQPAVQLGALAWLHSVLNDELLCLKGMLLDRQHRRWRLPPPAQLLWTRLLYRSSRRLGRLAPASRARRCAAGVPDVLPTCLSACWDQRLCA